MNVRLNIGDIQSLHDEVMVVTKCVICFGQIEDEQVTDPQCESTYHRNHLAAWLLTSETCPICKTSIPQDIRDSLKPKTREERQKLQGVRDEFSDFFVKSGKTDIESWELINNRLWLFIYTLSILLFLDIKNGFSLSRSGSLELNLDFWTIISYYTNSLALILLIANLSSAIFNCLKRKAERKIRVAIQFALSVLLYDVLPW